jgi:hypothetical protein
MVNVVNFNTKGKLTVEQLAAAAMPLVVYEAEIAFTVWQASGSLFVEAILSIPPLSLLCIVCISYQGILLVLEASK